MLFKFFGKMILVSLLLSFLGVVIPAIGAFVLYKIVKKNKDKILEAAPEIPALEEFRQ